MTKMWKLVYEAYEKFVNEFIKTNDVDSLYFILEEIGDRENLTESQYDFLCNKVYDKIPFF